MAQKDVFPGIDVLYRGQQGRLEYDFVVEPGANPDLIRLAFDGVDKLELDEGGDLILHVAGHRVLHRRPVVYQAIDGVRREIPARFALRGQNEVTFSLGRYDDARPLVIDPVVVYSTYLGGDQADEALAIAVDSSGSSYVTGRTYSANFPTTPGVIQRVYDGITFRFSDVFVSKFNGAGSLIYSTYIGGGNTEW